MTSYENCFYYQLTSFADVGYKRKRFDEGIETLSCPENMEPRKRQRRRTIGVRFNDSVECNYIEHNNDLTDDDRKRRWYQEDELLQIRLFLLDYSIAFRGYQSSLPDSILYSSMLCHLDIDNDSLRGIEHLCIPSFGHSRKQVRSNARLAVLLEQSKQNYLSAFDAQSLARLYGSYSANAVKNACDMAACDALVATSIMEEDASCS